MRYLFSLILLLFLTKDTIAQVNRGCKCNYYSSFDVKSYVSTIDSIVRTIRKNKNDIIQVIGSRGFAAAIVTVSVKRNNKMAIYCYNFRTKKHKVATSANVDAWINCLAKDSSFMHRAKANTLLPSHDYSYYISFNYPSTEINEICNSVVLNNIEQPFSKCLKSYVAFFEEVTK